jgi:hypothetical protein
MAECIKRSDLSQGDTVLEIGSNDGTLLAMYQALGYRVVGVDPAADIARSAMRKGIPTEVGFWGATLGRDLASGIGKVMLVIANNVMAHVPDVYDFALGVRNVLAPDGLFVFEVAHLLDWQETMSWDTVYHEHMSYHSVGPLVKMFHEMDMEVIDVQRLPGQVGRGSLRVWVAHKGKRAVSPWVSDIIGEETRAGLYGGMFYRDLSNSIARQKKFLKTHLDVLRNKGLRLAGYGAPAKLTTLMYTLDIGVDLCNYIVEDNPRKVGLFTPGLKIPVVGRDVFKENPPDVCVIYAWNFASSIMAEWRSFAADNAMRFVIPMPVYQEIEMGRGDLYWKAT